MRIAFRKLTPTPHKDNENLAERVTNVFITNTGVAPVLFVTPRGSRDFNPRQSRKGFGRFVQKLGSSMHLFQILFHKCYSISKISIWVESLVLNEIKWKMTKCKIQSKLVQNRIVKIILNLNRKKLSSISKLNTAFFKYQ